MWKFNINKHLIPMKLHYFFYNTGTGPVVPFLSVYARQLGFSSVIVGLIYTILPLCGMVAKPIMGAISDHFMCQKKIFLAAQLLSAAAFLGIFYSPKLPINRNVDFSCGPQDVEFRSTSGVVMDKCLIDQLKEETLSCKFICPNNKVMGHIICDEWKLKEYCKESISDIQFTGNIPINGTSDNKEILFFPINEISFNSSIVLTNPTCFSANGPVLCKIECSDYNLNSLLEQPSVQDSDVDTLYQFWTLLLLMITAWTGQALVVSIGDAICFQMLGDHPERYGHQRLFGSLGWGIITPITGLVVDAMSKGQSEKDYTFAFYLSASMLLLDFAISCTLKHRQVKKSTNILKDVGKLFRELRIIVFLLWCIAVGMCTALLWNFIFWLVEDLAKAQGCDSQGWIKTLEGTIMAINCLGGELPFFFLSGRILKKIGHVNAMTLVLLVLGIRFILYYVVSNPWWFLPIEFSNGLTFGLFYACMASYAYEVAPPGTEATMQGLVGAVFEGVGVSIGSLIAGILYGKYGGPDTFKIFGIAALITCLIHGVVQYFVNDQAFEIQYESPKEALKKLKENNELSEMKDIS